MLFSEQFFVPHLNANAMHGNLPPEEARHALKVLRLKPGSEFWITNGQGLRFQARLQLAGKGEAPFQVLACFEDGESNLPTLELAVAMPKAEDRLEWVAEKAVELGIGKLTLLVTERTEKQKHRIDRIERIMAGALKQSLRSVLPQLNGPIPYVEWLASSFPKTRILTHCNPAMPYVNAISKAFAPNESAVALIGPEGDFTITEVEAAINIGFISTHLGPIRLRTETAAMVVAAAFHAAAWQAHSPAFGKGVSLLEPL